MKKGFFSVFFFLGLALLFLNHSFGQSHFYIGHEEGDGYLIDPRQIEEGPDGNIYIFDASDAYIKVFSPEGKYLRRIGGKGQGPGEFQRADGSGFGFTSDGKLYFTEYTGGHRWITFMELSGEFINVLTLKINEVFGVSCSSTLEDGSFLVEISLNSIPEKKNDYFLYRSPEALVRVDSTGKTIAEIIKTNYFTQISSIGDGGTSWIPFIPVFTWTPFKNNTVIFADGSSQNLKVYDYKGRFIHEIETGLPLPEKVTGKDLNQWRKRRKESMSIRDKAWYNRFGRVIEKYKKSIYKNKPNLNRISLTPAGNILVSGPWDYDEGKINYWLLDEKGKSIAQIHMAIHRLNISKHFILFTTSNEEGITLVHCLKRRGSEREGLLKISSLNPFY